MQFHSGQLVSPFKGPIQLLHMTFPDLTYSLAFLGWGGGRYYSKNAVSKFKKISDLAFQQCEKRVNPFDTEHRAKITVKFGILRVVMLWPRQS